MSKGDCAVPVATNSTPLNRAERRHPERRRWVSIKQAAEYLGVSTRTIFQMMADGRLVAYKNGTRFIRLDLNEVDDSMKPVK
jgi:excisionase family DNA binding protein